MPRAAANVIRDATQHSVQNMSVPAALSQAIRRCFHLLIRQKYVQLAVVMYRKLMDIGYQLSRSDMAVLFCNLPYEQSSTDEGAAAKEWFEPKRRGRTASATVVASHPKSQDESAAGVSSSPLGDASGTMEATVTPILRRQLPSQQRWLKRWIAMEMALGNVPFFDEHSPHDEAGSSARVSFPSVGRVEPSPLIQHLLLLQETGPKVARLKHISRRPATSTSYWMEALHIGSMFLTSSKSASQVSLALAVNNCAPATSYSSSWLVHYRYLAQRAATRRLTASPLYFSIREDAPVEVEVAVRMLHLLIRRVRNARFASRWTAATRMATPLVGEYENIVQCISACETLLILQRSKRRNVRQLLLGIVSSVTMAVSHLFIDIKRQVDLGKRRSQVSESIASGRYTPPLMDGGAKTDAAASLGRDRDIGQGQLTAQFVLTASIIKLLSRLFPVIELLPRVDQGVENNLVDSLVVKLLFGSTGCWNVCE